MENKKTVNINKAVVILVIAAIIAISVGFLLTGCTPDMGRTVVQGSMEEIVMRNEYNAPIGSINAFKFTYDGHSWIYFNGLTPRIQSSNPKATIEMTMPMKVIRAPLKLRLMQSISKMVSTMKALSYQTQIPKPNMRPAMRNEVRCTFSLRLFWRKTS